MYIAIELRSSLIRKRRKPKVTAFVHATDHLAVCNNMGGALHDDVDLFSI